MSTFTPIDLSQLPQPSVVETLDFESILAERKAYAISLWPADEQDTIAQRLALESEPITKLLQESAYRELLLRQRVNEAAQATLLATATGTDLDQVAANFNVQRLVITPGNTASVPPTAEVLESDDSLRERAQMAFEGLTTAGSRNSYIFHARSSDGRVADATAESPSPATVVITIQAGADNGAASPELLAVVEQYLSHEDRRPLADRLTVQSAEVIEFQVHATLYLASPGPEGEPVRLAAEQALRGYVTQRRRLGVEVSASAIHAALHVEGVRRVQLHDWDDITPTLAQCAYCVGLSVVLGEQ